MSIFSGLRKRYRIEGTQHRDIDTGRRRYRVECLECHKLLHEATTGPHCRCKEHDKEACFATETVGSVIYAARRLSSSMWLDELNAEDFERVQGFAEHVAHVVGKEALRRG